MPSHEIEVFEDSYTMVVRVSAAQSGYTKGGTATPEVGAFEIGLDGEDLIEIQHQWFAHRIDDIFLHCNISQVVDELISSRSGPEPFLDHDLVQWADFLEQQARRLREVQP